MSEEEQQEPTPAQEEEAAPAPEEPAPEPEEAAPAPPPPPPPQEKPKMQQHAPSFEDDSGRNEAQVRMEEEKKKRMAKMEEEMKEYEEMRKEEREKLEAEISDLRAKREQRKQERAEEEKRLAELRAVEEQKRRAEEEERQRRKREEEAARREEREKKKREAEERIKSESQRNFTISKKSGSEADPTKQAGASGADGETKQGKSKEQLEAEKKAAMEQRIQPLNIAGFGESQLQEKAKELFNKIYALEGDKYDLEQRFKTQNMEMVELTERARQMQKGGQKGTSSKVQTAPDPMAEKLGGIPPKIVMYSQYERVKDHRGFNERQDLFKGPIYGVEYERIKPKSKVVITEQGPRAVEEYEENGGGAEPAPAAEVAAQE